MLGALALVLVIGGAALYEYLKSKAPPTLGAGPGVSPDNQSKFGVGSPAVPPVLAKGIGATAPYVDQISVPANFPLDIQTQFGSRLDTSPAPPADAPVTGTNVLIEDGIQRLASAIAHAEGYGSQGAIPTLANNPGDLKLGDHGYGTINGKTKFGSPAEGWAHLRAQIRLGWLDRSDYYGPDDTFRQIAETWTGGDHSEEWLKSVTADLGVGPDTTLRGYLNQGVVRR